MIWKIVGVVLIAAIGFVLLSYKLDDNFDCSVDRIFINNAWLDNIAEINPKESRKSFNYTDDFIGSMGGWYRIRQQSPISVGVHITNVSTEPQSFSISMSMESNGIIWKPIEISYWSNDEHQIQCSSEVNFTLAAGEEKPMSFDFDNKMYDEGAPQQSIVQTVHMGETSPQEAVFFQKLIRAKSGYNCIFSPGHNYKPG